MLLVFLPELLTKNTAQYLLRRDLVCKYFPVAINQSLVLKTKLKNKKKILYYGMGLVVE